MDTILAATPVALAAVLIVGMVPVLAIACVLMLRRRVGFDSMVVNNEVAGFKYATLGVSYGVLIAFLMISVWERFDNAERVVEAEASSLLDLARLADGFPDAQRAEVRTRILDYLTIVIEQEWPQMRNDVADHRDGDLALDGLSRVILGTAHSGSVPTSVMAAAIDIQRAVTDFRRERIAAAQGTLPAILWWMTVIGGVITVGFTLFFASPNIRAQAAMTAMLSIVIMSLVLITVMMNHPFVGDIAVGVEPLAQVRDQINTQP